MRRSISYGIVAGLTGVVVGCVVALNTKIEIGRIEESTDFGNKAKIEFNSSEFGIEYNNLMTNMLKHSVSSEKLYGLADQLLKQTNRARLQQMETADYEEEMHSVHLVKRYLPFWVFPTSLGLMGFVIGAREGRITDRLLRQGRIYSEE